MNRSEDNHTSANEDLIVGVRIVSCGPAGVIENGFVQVADGQVTALGSMSELPPALAGQGTSFSGCTVLPGLINSHFHFQGHREMGTMTPDDPPAQNAVRAVRSGFNCFREGVTTVRDMGHDDKVRMEWRDSIKSGAILGPRVIAAASALNWSYGHAWFCTYPVDSVEEVATQVRRHVFEGYDFIKLITSHEDLASPGGDELTVAWMPEEAIRTAVEWAHLCGVPISTHAMGTEAIRRCVDSGVDFLEHGIYLNKELAERMANAGIIFVPTIHGYRSCGDPKWGAEIHSEIPFARYQGLAEVHVASARNALDAGVKMLVGTDVLGSMADELEILCNEVGMGSEATLRAATIEAARAFGIDGETGSIEVGKVADLVVVRGDPMANISDIRNVEQVYVKGVGLHRSFLDKLVPPCKRWAAGW